MKINYTDEKKKNVIYLRATKIQILNTNYVFIFLFNLFSITSLVSTSQLRSSLPYNVLYPNTTIQFSNEYTKSEGECRNDMNCFLPYGICLNSTVCLCMPEFANIYVPGHSIQELSCSYKRKKVVLAAVLEFFLPMGLGHFYVGQYRLGLAKLLFTLFLYSFCCLMYSRGLDHPKVTNSILCCFCLSCILPLWNFVDLLLFFTDVYRDGYGVPLV